MKEGNNLRRVDGSIAGIEDMPSSYAIPLSSFSGLDLTEFRLLIKFKNEKIDTDHQIYMGLFVNEGTGIWGSNDYYNPASQPSEVKTSIKYTPVLWSSNGMYLLTDGPQTNNELLHTQGEINYAEIVVEPSPTDANKMKFTWCQ